MDLTFGIDVDEVLRGLLNNMVNLYNRDIGRSITTDDVKDFVVENSFPDVEDATGITTSDWFFRTHGHELFGESEPVKGAVRAVKKLHKYGKIIIITYQKSIENKVDTIEWLHNNGIEYDGICMIKDKTLVHTDYLVDDNDWNFIGSNATHGILITAPYNKEVDIEELRKKSNCETMQRMGSLSEFADYIERKYRK